jgi:hypothetical protein
MRGSSSGSKVDEDTLVHSIEPREQKAAGEGNISKCKKASKKYKKKNGTVCTSSSSTHRIQPFSYSLLPLEVLLVSISQGFLRLFRLSQCCFSALTLAAVVMSKAFRETLSSASSEEMRTLAVAKASARHQGGKRKSSNKQRKVRKIHGK